MFLSIRLYGIRQTAWSPCGCTKSVMYGSLHYSDFPIYLFFPKRQQKTNRTEKIVAHVRTAIRNPYHTAPIPNKIIFSVSKQKNCPLIFFSFLQKNPCAKTLIFSSDFPHSDTMLEFMYSKLD